MAPRLRRERVAALLAASLAVVTLGAQCEPGTIEVRNRPPDPVLADADGEVDLAGFDALVAAVEAERGLGFIQHPTLELVRADDARVAAWLAAARALDPCPRSGAAADATEDATGRCFADASLEWVTCVAPPALGEARRALRRLLDAQNHPRLARAAAMAAGDPGVALRALLAASAGGAPPPGVGPPDPDAEDLFDLERDIEIEPQEAPSEACEAAAAHFLLAVSDDREAAFRRPPLSTFELFGPKRWRAGERAVALRGPPPRVTGCRLGQDESIGVGRLVVEASRQGGRVPVRALAGWRGDRALRFTCDDGAERWIYAVEASDEARAAALAASVALLLPQELAGPSEARALGRRVVVVSRGLAVPGALRWASALAPEPLRDLAQVVR